MIYESVVYGMNVFAHWVDVFVGSFILADTESSEHTSSHELSDASLFVIKKTFTRP
jgi:hypothetical protein